jgi:hypothetical protein
VLRDGYVPRVSDHDRDTDRVQFDGVGGLRRCE